MSGYRRFIAYVYEYREGRKGEGRGFIKVEARNGTCRMRCKLTGIYEKETAPAKVYGYVREEGGCTGIFLGDCNLAGERVEFELETPEEHMGESRYGLGDLCGLILLADSGELYGSGWDELPVNLQEIKIPKAQQREIEKESREVQAAQTEEYIEGEEENDSRLSEKEDREENLQEEAEEETLVREPAKEPMQNPGKDMEREPENAEENETAEYREEMEEEDFDAEPEEVERADEILKRETELPSFCDNGITQCRKITPGDLGILSRRDRGLLTNRFLRHGFSRYGHLLIGKREEDGRYILGVPGVYESQEALMAGMFGFPYFKETGGANGHSRYFGYWYRMIDRPQGME